MKISVPGWAAWAAVFALVFLSPLVVRAAPVNAQASPQAKSLLRYLYSISGKRILSGQHNYTMNRSGYSDRAAQIAGKYPAVWGSDFGHGPESLAKRQEMIDEAKRQHAQGSIITLMWHAVRPMDEETAGWKESVQADLTPAQWRELVTPGTPLHKRWLAQVDTVAAYLKQLQRANVPVLWRPYHEMNGGWFWWGRQKGEAGYKKLWRLLYDRLTDYHKLNNLIWVWNAGAPDPKWAGPYADYYPGPAYVDVLAADIYNGDYKQGYYDDLLRLAGNKPIALGEVGELPTPAVLSTQPRWTWFMTWPSHLEQNNKPETVQALYNDSRTLNRDAARRRRRTLAPRAENIVYPADAGVLNVRDAKYGAQGDGATDDTAAIQKALTEGLGQHRIVYLPNGTYVVRDTLRWRDPARAGDASDGWGPFLQLQGQSRAGTVIKLQNDAPGFGDPNAPRAVIQTGSSAGHGPKRYTNGEGNEAFENHIRNLTVDVGSGNAGAIGIDYQVSNVGAMRHVSVRSSDPNGAGWCGVNLTRRDNGPGLLKDVSIEGFRFGTRMDQELAQIVLEDVTLSGQREAGLWNRNGILCARKIRSRGPAPALKVSGVSLTILLDSFLEGVGASGGAVEAQGDEARLYVRNLQTRGYAAAIQGRNKVEKRAPVAEWLSDPVMGASRRDAAGPLSLNLPVRETPQWYDPDRRNWADAGAPSGGDDMRAIQAAMNVNKSTVYFRHGRYRIRDTITVPPHVRLILGVGAELDAPERLSGDRPLFRLAGGAAGHQTIFDRLAGGTKGGVLIEHADGRTVVLRDLILFATQVYRNTVPASGPLFVEDVASAAYRFEHPTRVWARQWNIEGPGEPKVKNNGATIWALGWKREGGETLVENRGGGLMELLGGLVYTFGVEEQKAAFINEDADLALSFAGVSYVGGERPFFPTLVRETHAGKTSTFTRGDALPRGGGASVPLYVSLRDTPPAGAGKWKPKAP